MFKIDGKYTSALVTTNNADELSIKQVENLTNHPSFTNPIAMMLDIHAGAGAPIGFTMELTDSLVPNIVGNDIGCAILAYKVKKPKNLNLAKLDQAIRSKIPFSTKVRQIGNSDNRVLEHNDVFYTQVQSSLNNLWMKLREKFGTFAPSPPTINHDWYIDKCIQIGMDFERAQMSIGTLGSGNHFVEFGNSSIHPDYMWITIHSGSRQFGKMICDHHQNIAIQRLKDFREGKYQKAIEDIKKTSHPRDIEKNIAKFKADNSQRIEISKGLESLSGKAMYDYLYDMIFAQHYASLNRFKMMEDILTILAPKSVPRNIPMQRPTILAEPPLEVLETIHNYIDPEDLIIRKGAVAARSGQKIVIPFNMKDGIWICKGQGNTVWNNSAPHGAGRLMSRTKAREVLKKEDAEKAMEGIYTSCIPLDEAPGAYKLASEIKNAIGPTAGIVEEVKPFMNLKAK